MMLGWWGAGIWGWDMKVRRGEVLQEGCVLGVLSIAWVAGGGVR